MTFHKASLKLAGLYLAILMTISILFSTSLYQTSLHELERGLRRPTQVFNLPAGPGFSTGVREQLLEERQAQYDTAHERLLSNLIFVNILILVGGGLASYFLAVRTLKPIEEAHEAQSRFAADASHELRTPITAMRTETEVALMDQRLTLADAKKQLSSNIEELVKLTALAEDLLRLAQLDDNHTQKTPTDPKTITTAAIERVSGAASVKNITLKKTISAKAKLLGDEASVTEALVTLLDNAIKYSPAKSVVALKVMNDHHYVIFTVTDHGSGIAADELPHIFDRFYRADSSRTKQDAKGYGLGLAIAKSVVESHHGLLNAQSEAGKGSVFTLSLPIAQE